MAFLLQVWVIVLATEALCCWQLHRALGVPFPALRSGFITWGNPLSKGTAAAKISDAGQASRREQVSPLSPCGRGLDVKAWERAATLRGSTPADRKQSAFQLGPAFSLNWDPVGATGKERAGTLPVIPSRRETIVMCS
ncbi:hypothetical protein CgunFtcFv8_015921 [Champsocephalus gunnari]|uniref:Uncharacterized protein n=1 Tax=Champsocephalus gunnari TaxID=52237 RepID=A0AAN8C7B3_CHAGU|nr:hypothetical protein CgunFtcFv8_015921 [Champsocephalus gunnari]